MKYSALVFKNLFRSKRRTFLTVLSIAVSLFIFSALVSIPDGGQPDSRQHRFVHPDRDA